MPADSAQYIHQLTVDWPLTSEKQYTWPGHFQAIKRAVKQTFPSVDGAVLPSHVELNTLAGKEVLFNGILATPVRQSFFYVSLTAGLLQSFAVPEALVGDYVYAAPNSAYSTWRTLKITAAWVTEKGRIALFFCKLGTTNTLVEDTGPIKILLVRP